MSWVGYIMIREVSRQDGMVKKTDCEIILESIKIVVADKERFKRVLINTGIYDKDLKLIKTDKDKENNPCK